MDFIGPITADGLLYRLSRDYYRRFYVALTHGWFKVTKAQIVDHVGAEGRRDVLYHYHEEHEKNVGNVVYIRPYTGA